MNMSLWTLAVLPLLLSLLLSRGAEAKWPADGGKQQPQQIHIAWAIDADDCMLVTWSTEENTTTSTAVYALKDADETMTASGRSIPFTDAGSMKRTQFVHHVALCNLKSDELYRYYVGDAIAGWSSPAFFRAKPYGSARARPLVMAVYGDLGDTNSMSLSMIESSVYKGGIDGVIHVGDFAYDLQDENGAVGDAFMNDIQPIAGTLPYMTCPGNHEINQNFNHYRNRFSRSFLTTFAEAPFYSFDVSNVHFVSINTEIYFVDHDQVRLQYEWLQKDLAAANSKRDVRPWIIAFGHRPPYCSTGNNDDCGKADSLVRKGLKQPDGSFLYGLEELLYVHGVDVALWGHEHNYERLYPLFNGDVIGDVSNANSYHNPQAPIHVTTGSAGCKEEHDPFYMQTPPAWSASRFVDYGWGKLTIESDTTLHWQQFSIDQGGIVADEFTIHQTNHGRRQLPETTVAYA